MKSIHFITAALFTLSFSLGSIAAPVQVFGPQKYAAPVKGATYNSNFTHTQNNAQGVITVINGDGSDLSAKNCSGLKLVQTILCVAENVVRAAAVVLLRPASVEVSVNGVVKVTSAQLPPAMGSYQVSVIVNKTNTVQVKIKGSPLAYISLGIKAESASVNLPPVANFTFNPNNGIAPVIVSFSGLTSSDDQGIASYDWEFGDGGVAQGAVVDHLFNGPGVYAVKLTVRDAQGASNTKIQNVTVIQDTTPPLLTIVKPVQGSVIQNAAVVIQGSANERLQSVTAQLNGESVYSLDLSSDAMSFSGSVATGISGARSLTVVAKDIAGNISTKVVGFTYDNSLPPVARLALKTASVGTAPMMVLLDGSQSSDPNGQSLSYVWDFGDGTVSSDPQFATYNYEQPGSYTIILKVTNQSGLSDSKSITINVAAPVLPLDPITIAPPLTENNAPISFKKSISFLYDGSNPSQRNVTAGFIDEARVGVIRGQIINENNQPLGGVKVSVNNVSELGYTLTRADGTFNIAVNGGGDSIVQYEMNGYLPAQRSINVRYNDYSVVETTVLVKTDPVVTKISNNAPVSQVVIGSNIQDKDGQRTAKIMIPASTTASIELPGGGTMQLPILSLRVTEYTVGEKGPQRMPASLPQTTSYTYAVDVTADEALALGAMHINFSKPVSFYTDNFLNFAIGTIIPVGSYDYDKGYWISQPNGLVLKVLNIQNGKAVLDVTGSSSPASSTQLANLGITEDELIKIASQYSSGESFWRTQVTRFSPVDGNFLSASGNAPPIDALDSNNPNCPVCGTKTQNASTIEHLNQNLRESLPLVGVDFNLQYSSKSTSIVPNVIPIRLLATNNPDLQSITVKVSVAGKETIQTFPPIPNQIYNFTWDGKDAFERPLSGRTKAQVTITYQYPSNYLAPLVASPATWGVYPTVLTNTNIAGRELDQVSTTYDTFLGGSDNKNSIGQWRIPIYHSLDLDNNTLYYGDGSIRGGINPLYDNRRTIEVVMGDGTVGVTEDGRQAKGGRLTYPHSLALSKDKGIYFIDNYPMLRKINSDGTIQTIAGSRTSGYSGDGGPATQAQLGFSSYIAVTEGDNGDIYIFDVGNNVIRKIDKSGIITTYAGNGNRGYSGNGVPALQAQLSVGLLKFFQGSLYIADFNFHLIRQITPDGIIHTLVGKGGTSGYSPDGTSATEALVNGPFGLDFNSAGELIFSETNNGLIRKIAKDGTLESIAGSTSSSNVPTADGEPALGNHINSPGRLHTLKDGTIFYQEGTNTIRFISPNGMLRTLAGNISNTAISNATEGAFSTQTSFNLLGDFDISSAGEVYLAETFAHRILKVGSPISFIKDIGGTYSVPSEDGSEVYVFNELGQHLFTSNGLTGGIKYNFIRNADGFLIAIIDGDGNVTQINRNSSNQVSDITGPYGQSNILSFDSSGNLAQLQMPSGDNYGMNYGINGLLSSFQKPNSGISSFEYDSLGNIVKDTDAAGGWVSLSKSYSGPSLLISSYTSEGVSQSTAKQEYNNETIISNGLPDGHTLTTYLTGTSQRNLDNRGNLQTVYLSSDSRFKTPVSFPSFQEETREGTSRDEYFLMDYVRLNGLFDFKKKQTTLLNGVIRNIASFDSINKTFQNVSGENRSSVTVVDNQLRPISIQTGNLTPTLLQYDQRGRLSSVNTGSRATSNTYGSNGLISATTDSLNRVHQFVYDQNLRKIKDIFPDGREANYHYDGNGNLISITPPERPTHRFGFNLVDLGSSYVAPSIGGNSATIYEYDKNKRLKKITRPDDQTLTNEYDFSRDWLLSTTTATGQFNYQYDRSGRLLLARSPDLITTNYNYSGDLVSSQNNSGAISSSLAVTYNNLLKPSNINAQGSGISYAYDKDEYLASAGSENLVYDSNSLLSLIQLGSFSESRTYNSFGEQISASHFLGNTPLLIQNYTRDALGRISAKTEGSDSYNYTYDPSGRLTDVVKNGVNVGHYNYDANGNRTSTSIRGVNSTATTDDQDRMIAYGTKSFTYNLGGDLTSITYSLTGVTKQFSYDVFSNLKQAIVPGKNIQYLADSSNRRIAKRVNGTLSQGFVYQSQTQIAAELDGNSNLVARFIYASKTNSPDYMDKGGAIYKFIHDQLGSIRQVVNISTGFVIQDIQYDEFGVVLSDSNPGFQPFGFAGGLYDRDTGLVRFGARDYDPEIGRWTTKDPIGFAGGDSNLYAYAAHDPVNSTDPTGLDSQLVVNTHGHFSLEVITGGKVTTVSMGPADPNLRFGNVMGTVAITEGRDTDNHAVPLSLKSQSGAADKELIKNAQALQKAYDSGDLGYNFLGGSIGGWGTNCLVFSKTLQNSIGN